MKLGQVCHANRGVEEGCFPKRSPIYALDGRVLNASGWDKLAGGAACASLLNGGIMCFDSSILVVDVNGYAPPNKVGADIFARGCCLPSDNKMTAQEQDWVIEVIRRCFD